MTAFAFAGFVLAAPAGVWAESLLASIIPIAPARPCCNIARRVIPVSPLRAPDSVCMARSPHLEGGSMAAKELRSVHQRPGNVQPGPPAAPAGFVFGHHAPLVLRGVARED